MNATELKARAYDVLAQIQFLQQELVRINGELERLATEGSEESPSDATEE
jgi:hypothetical protein